MPRSLRFLPEEDTRFEITNQTLQGRFLLVPSDELNEIILGALGRAQQVSRLLGNWLEHLPVAHPHPATRSRSCWPQSPS